METVERVLLHKGRTIYGVGPTETVTAAVVSMCSAHVGALIVRDGDDPIGIFTERDVMTRVILAGRDPAQTLVGEVMTRRVVCVEPSTTIAEAMSIMTARHCRHLPVIDAEGACGVVSIGDLVERLAEERETELRLLESYIVGQYPG